MGHMRILAIETSCDDTGVAILEVKNGKSAVLSNIVSSQQIHANYGGVFPMMAKREHQNNLVPVLTEALKNASMLKVLEKPNSPRGINGELASSKTKMTVVKKILKKESGLYEFTKKFLEMYEKPKIDYIAVTNGPGLEPCLHVGVNFAKALSYTWNIPVIPVNHIEGHILVNFLAAKSLKKARIFPAVSLVVSGGHTQLILVKDVGNYEIIGETRDDAAGECFDKAARILGLPYPGGPEVARVAAQFQPSTTYGALTLPRPMMHTKDYDFSFSGLKTAVLYTLRDTDPKVKKNQEFTQQMCHALQDAICDVLVKKTINAAKDYKAKTIILGGGVSANRALREQFTVKVKQEKLTVIFPEPKLSTDNALMIAITAYFHQDKKVPWNKVAVDANLRVG
jgi:N6-L-threonylcarbamoyladenine synthase